ncbi:MAG: hypothetical protein HJJLKODD_00560 [Phycisphaerae bacterium]|nr:hypothetical protein [Phycisphaerae bacterium]
MLIPCEPAIQKEEFIGNWLLLLLRHKNITSNRLVIWA